MSTRIPIHASDQWRPKEAFRDKEGVLRCYWCGWPASPDASKPGDCYLDSCNQRPRPELPFRVEDWPLDALTREHAEAQRQLDMHARRAAQLSAELTRRGF